MEGQHGWCPPERPKARRTRTGDCDRRRDEARTASSLPAQVFAAQAPGVERQISGALGDVLVREMARAPAPRSAPSKPPQAKRFEPVPADELQALVEHVAANGHPARAPQFDTADVEAELAWVLVDVAGQSPGRPRQVASLRLSDLIGDATAFAALGREVLAELVDRLDAADPQRVGNHMLLRVLRIAAERELARFDRGVASA